MPTICLLNQKGGVGKTATCFHLSGTLAHLGHRVLLVDNDPQASLTQGFIGPKGMRALPKGETIAAIYAGDDPFPEQVIRTVMPGIDLLSGSRLATRYNLPEPQELPPATQGSLKAFLGELEGRYDTILIDCPPNLHLCSWAALTASSHLVVPLQPEDSGAQGLSEVQDSIDLVRGGPNPGLLLAGYLVTMINTNRSLHKLFEASLRELYHDDVFDTRIPDLVDFPEATSRRKPVAAYKPKGAGAKIMLALADELDSRLTSRRVA